MRGLIIEGSRLGVLFDVFGGVARDSRFLGYIEEAGFENLPVRTVKVHDIQMTCPLSQQMQSKQNQHHCDNHHGQRESYH